VFFQVVSVVSIPRISCDNKFAASANSYCDYGQFAISQSKLGHIMYYKVTTCSTMDFSMKPINDGAVDSLPNGRKHLNNVNSPSPMK